MKHCKLGNLNLLLAHVLPQKLHTAYKCDLGVQAERQVTREREGGRRGDGEERDEDMGWTWAYQTGTEVDGRRMRDARKRSISTCSSTTQAHAAEMMCPDTNELRMWSGVQRPVGEWRRQEALVLSLSLSLLSLLQPSPHHPRPHSGHYVVLLDTTPATH